MNDIQIFDNPEFGSIRAFDSDGEPWFVAKDVCAALEIGNTSQALSRLDDDEKGVILNDTHGGKQEFRTVNEPGLYSLVLSSRKPEAKAFKRWVTHEVLPSIHKHGAYMTDGVLEKAIADPDFMIGLLTEMKAEREARIEAERTRDRLLHASKTYTTTEIAKELGMRSAQRLNKELEERHVQFKQNGTWLLYSRYADMGLTSVKQTVLDNGRVIYDRRWTGTGRDFLLDLLEDVIQ